MYKEYYIGDISFGVFKQLLELFSYTPRPLLDKEVHFAIEYIDDEYHLEVIYPGIINITFKKIDGESLISFLYKLALSMGSACNSSMLEPSFVLINL